MAKKLIEVALPLEKINAESAREKSIRHGHPSTLHLWWARRPLAAARAVIWSSLVDDPSSHPELFPTEKEQGEERQRLFKILEQLVVWENINNKELLTVAKKEILKFNKGGLPTLLDPFAGGGAIPLEAQRLGLETYAHDLNPIAVTINKAMIEIPHIFNGRGPVNPESSILINGIVEGASGLVEDIRYYGRLLKKEAFSKIGHLYPLVDIPDNLGGGKTNAIAWIWTRTVKCPNPACGCNMPLASSFSLSTKKGSSAIVTPDLDYANKKIRYIVHNRSTQKAPEAGKTARGVNFKCIMCGEAVSGDYIKKEAVAKRMNAQLMAIVAEGKNGRIYVSPNEEQENAANINRPSNVPDGEIAYNPRDIRTQLYGFYYYSELYSNRQLVELTTFCDLIKHVRQIVERDAVNSGMKDNHISLDRGGDGAKAYSEAIGVYLSFLIDKLADYHSAICSWNAAGQKMRNTFGRQAIPMVWDYAECNPFCNSSGSFDNMLNWIVKSVGQLPCKTTYAKAEQFDASIDCGLRNIMVSTDPPYYDNIGYADLSDYFYVWLRHNLRETYPSLFSTMLVPKSEELIATPYRHNGNAEFAKKFFEKGMLSTCQQIYKYASSDIPVTIYYAYKQSDTLETSDGRYQTASTGWETMLSSIINSGFMITGTWPIRTEMAVRMVASGSNALASSIVLVCRKRADDSTQITRRNLSNILRRELRPALKKLQESNIAPVDLAQSAIGPGMGVYSRYKRVLEADGTQMTVRSALQLINEEIDLYFNEQVGDMDAASRFCIDLYTQNAYNDIKYGEAEVLANAKGTSIPMMSSRGLLYAKAGNVHLIERNELPEEVDINENNIWMLTQQLTQAMATGGVEVCAKIVASMFGSNADRAKDLAYRLYTIAEQKKWANEAYAYNALVVAWSDIQSRAASLKEIAPEQLNLFDLMDDSQ